MSREGGLMLARIFSGYAKPLIKLGLCQQFCDFLAARELGGRRVIAQQVAAGQ